MSDNVTIAEQMSGNARLSCMQNGSDEFMDEDPMGGGGAVGKLQSMWCGGQSLVSAGKDLADMRRRGTGSGRKERGLKGRSEGNLRSNKKFQRQNYGNLPGRNELNSGSLLEFDSMEGLMRLSDEELESTTTRVTPVTKMLPSTCMMSRFSKGTTQSIESGVDVIRRADAVAGLPENRAVKLSDAKKFNVVGFDGNAALNCASGNGGIFSLQKFSLDSLERGPDGKGFRPAELENKGFLGMGSGSKRSSSITGLWEFFLLNRIFWLVFCRE